MDIKFLLFNDGKSVCGIYGALAQFTEGNDAKVYTDSEERRRIMFINLQAKLKNMESRPIANHPITDGLLSLQLADADDKEWEFDELRIYTVENDLVETFPIEDVINFIDYEKVTKQITAIRSDVFNLANSLAGNHTGNAGTYLHQSCNKMLEALDCIERGNSSDEPMPLDAMIESMGGMDTMMELNKLCSRK